MQELELISLFVKPLETDGYSYFVTGSVASILYGEPRLTHDIDLVVHLNRSILPKLIELFPESDFYCPPIEVLQIEVTRQYRGHFNLIHHESGFKADIYLVGEDPFQQWALANVRRITIGDLQIAVAPPEYVIVKKLEYFKEGGSEKHLRDIAAMLVVSETELDRSLLEKFIDDRELSKQWSCIDKN